jgi:hypothetical protein
VKTAKGGLANPGFRRVFDTGNPASSIGSPYGAYHYGTSTTVHGPTAEIAYVWGARKGFAFNTSGIGGFYDVLTVWPHFFGSAGTLKKIVTVTNISTSTRAGIYSQIDANTFYPETLLWDSGAFSAVGAASAQRKSWAPNVEVSAGTFLWFCLWAKNMGNSGLTSVIPSADVGDFAGGDRSDAVLATADSGIVGWRYAYPWVDGAALPTTFPSVAASITPMRRSGNLPGAAAFVLQPATE